MVAMAGAGVAMAQQSPPPDNNSQDCTEARELAGAWLSAFGALNEGLQQDRFIGALPKSLVAADNDLKSDLDDLQADRAELLPVMEKYLSKLQEANQIVLKYCGPYR
jgi:hypothetical protein